MIEKFSAFVMYGFSSGVFNQVLLFIVILLVMRMAIRLQKRSDDIIDFRDLILGDDRKMSLIKIGQFTALVVSTWYFIVYTIRGTMSNEIFMFYIAVWTGTQVLNRFAMRNDKTYEQNRAAGEVSAAINDPKDGK